MTIFFVRELKLPKVGRLVAFGDINDVSMRVTRASSLSAHREAGLCGELRRESGWVRTLAKARQWLRSSGPQASKEALDSQAGSSHAVFFRPVLFNFFSVCQILRKVRGRAARDLEVRAGRGSFFASGPKRS